MSGAVAALLVEFPEDKQKRKQRDERESEKVRTSALVYPGVNHVWSVSGAEVADRADAEAIAEDCEGDDEGHEAQALPFRMEEEFAGDNADDEEDEAGPDAAANGRDLNADVWQLEDEGALAVDGYIRQDEHLIGGLGRGVLEEGIDQLFGRRGNGTEENEKGEGEEVPFKDIQSEDSEAAGQDEKNIGDDEGGQSVLDFLESGRVAVEPIGAENDEGEDRWNRSERKVAGGRQRIGLLRAIGPGEVDADHWNQREVRIERVLEG